MGDELRTFQGYVVDEYVGSDGASTALVEVIAPQAPVPFVSGSLRASSSNPDNRSESNQWRKLGRASSRNLATYDHKAMVAQCSRAGQVDGMARSHARLVRSITVGAQELGVEVRCKDQDARKRLQELVDIGWKHPANDLSDALGEFMDGLTSTGSLALCLHVDENEVGEGTMLTTIGYIDPETFVEPYVLADPGNARDLIAVLRSGWLSTGPKIVAHPILRNDDSVHPMLRGPDGKPLRPGATLKIPRRDQFGGPLEVSIDEPCMYVGINRVAPNQTCGISDFYTALDLMGLLDELVFGAVERSINIGAYAIQVKFPRGTSQGDIDDRMNKIRADLESGKGRAVGTTDDVTIQAVFAALQAGEWATLEKVARVNTLMGLGPWPVHMFSDGGATNVATAAEQGSPVANFLLDRQNRFRRFILKVVMYMLRRYPEARALLDKNPDAHLHLGLPVIVAKDTTRESNVWAVETQTLAAAEASGFVKLEAAQREWRDASNRYGMHFLEEDSPKAEEFKKAQEIALTLPPPGPPAGEDPPKEKPSEGTPARETA